MELSPERIQLFVLTLPIFLFSLTVHEMAHAITAKWGGDLTAAYLNRITLNPIPHIDPFGTILMPVIGAMTGIPLIGWAKPVPVNEQNFRRPNYGMIVALAGPFSNLLIAAFTVVAMQVTLLLMRDLFPQTPEPVSSIIGDFFLYMILINLALAIFNMIPIPPLDGSHILWHLFIKHRPELHNAFYAIRSYGFFILLLLLWTGAITVIFTKIAYPLLRLFMGLGQLPAQIG